MTKVTCEGWPHHWGLRPLLFLNSGVGSGVERISDTYLAKEGKESSNDNLCPVVYNILSTELPSFEFTKWQSKMERDMIDQLRPVNLKQYFISPSIILRLRCS